MIADENPYASPRSADPGGIPDAPESFGWSLAGKIVRVGKISLFPMIDPLTGGSDETMMLQKLQVRHRPRWLIAFPALGALLVLAFSPGVNGSDLATACLVGALAGWFFSGIAGLFFPACTMQLFFEKRTLRIRKTFDRVMNVMFSLAIVGAMLAGSGPEWLRVIPSVAFVAWIIGALASLLLKRRLRCVRRNGDLFEIRGFHPRALEALARESSSGNLTEIRR